MDVAITGSSGLIGRALVNALHLRGHRTIAVTRGTDVGADQIGWDIEAGQIDAGGFEGIDAVVHLAGESIAGGRWTDAKKRRILESRTKGTALLSETLASLANPPAVLLSGSAIGYYGDRGATELTEDSSSGEGFLAQVCRQWEAATGFAEAAGIRVVHARTGIVLSRHGGALAKQLPLFRFGLGGKVGRGDQYMSWITLDDEVGALVWLLDADTAGPVNLTAPAPVTNAEFADTLGTVLRRPTILPIPAFGPKLLLGSELTEELLLFSTRVRPARLEQDGYAFLHTDLERGLRAVLERDVEQT